MFPMTNQILADGSGLGTKVDRSAEDVWEMAGRVQATTPSELVAESNKVVPVSDDEVETQDNASTRSVIEREDLFAQAWTSYRAAFLIAGVGQLSLAINLLPSLLSIAIILGAAMLALSTTGMIEDFTK